MTKLDRDQIFLMYALVESARALHAFDEAHRLTTTIREIRSPTVVVRPHQAIFDAIRMALHFSANASKVFFRPISRGNGVPIGCVMLTEIPDDHALQSRALRNHVEHLDERLDTWTAEAPQPILAIEFAMYTDMLSSPLLQESIDSQLGLNGSRPSRSYTGGRILFSGTPGYCLRRTKSNIHLPGEASPESCGRIAG